MSPAATLLMLSLDRHGSRSTSHFGRVMRQLEEVWECELQSFEAARRLAQCLDLREQTYRRYALLKRQEAAAAKTLVSPQQEELYDVEL